MNLKGVDVEQKEEKVIRRYVTMRLDTAIRISLGLFLLGLVIGRLEKSLETRVQQKAIEEKVSMRDWDLSQEAAAFYKIDPDLLMAMRLHENGRAGYELGVNHVPSAIQRNISEPHIQYFAASLLVSRLANRFVVDRYPKEFVKYLGEKYNVTDKDHWTESVWIKFNRLKKDRVSSLPKEMRIALDARLEGSVD